MNAKKYHVTALDNLSVGNYRSIRELTDLGNVTFINCDISEAIPATIKEVDLIIHLGATRVNYEDYPDTNLYDLAINGTGTIKLLELAASCQARFVYTSTILLYRSLLEDFAPANLHTHREVKQFGEAYVHHYARDHHLNTCILRLPKVYGPGMNLHTDSPVGSLILNALGQEPLLVRNETNPNYYLYLTDCASGIVQTSLDETQKGIIPLLPESPVTALGVAQILAFLSEGELPIETVETGTPQITSLLPQENFPESPFRPQVSLELGLKKTLDKSRFVAPADEYTVEPPEQDEEQGFQPLKQIREHLEERKRPEYKAVRLGVPESPRKSRITALIFIFLTFVLLAFVLIPLGSLGYHLLAGRSAVLSGGEALKNLDIKSAKINGLEGQVHLLKAEGDLSRLRYLAKLTTLNSEHTSLKRAVGAGIHIAESEVSISSALTPLIEGASAMAPGVQIVGNEQGGFDAQQLSNSLSDAQDAEQKIQLALAEIKSIDRTGIPDKIEKDLSYAESQLNLGLTELSLLKKLINALPDLIGLSEDKRYLLLFQNSNELRATGGFIGSYAELSFHSGRLEDLIIDDIYNPDGQLLEKHIAITPPEPIKQILGQPQWFLRDSNWKASFPEATEDITRFYLLETGKSLDGVVALDLEIMKGFLEITGPLQISSYNEEVDSNNFFEKIQLHAEAGFIPGSNSKKTFLTGLSEELMTKIFEVKENKLPQLLGVLSKGLVEKHLLLQFDNNDMSDVSGSKNWNGAVSVAPDSDYLYVVDSNLGANKANYYVKRTVSLETEMKDRDGLMGSTLTVRYLHTGTSNNFPGGVYKNYLRVLVPKGSKLIKAMSVNANSDKGADITTQIKELEEAGKTEFATNLEVPTGKAVTIIINYTLPTDLALTTDKNAYSLIVQKQPGTKGDNFTLTFHSPFGRDLVLPQEIERIGDRARFDGPLTTDKVFTFGFK